MKMRTNGVVSVLPIRVEGMPNAAQDLIFHGIENFATLYDSVTPIWAMQAYALLVTYPYRS